MAPHSSTLAWKIPWTEEPVRLQSMGVCSSMCFILENVLCLPKAILVDSFIV